ncbi:hypothetical protein ACFLQU_01380 [Verrucomicrobiota bacterium]
MKPFHALFILFINTFLYGLFYRMGVPEFYLKFAIDWSVALLCLAVLGQRATELAPGLGFVGAYVCCVAVSTAMSTDSAYTGYRYARYSVYMYLVATCVWNARLSPKEVRLLLITLFGLLALQIAASLHEVYILNGRWEAIVGTVSATGGGMATSLPLFGMAYFIAFYLYCGRKPWLLVVAFMFPVVGYASHKRAIYFALPFLVVTEYLWFMLRERRMAVAAEWVRLAVAIGFTMATMLYGIRNTARIAVYDADGIGEELTHAADYAQEYTVGETKGQTTGRIATSARVLHAARERDLGHVLFGWGPGAMMGTGGKFDELEIIYGATGWARDVISVGWLATLNFCLFFLSYWLRLGAVGRLPGTSHWKALCLGTHMAFMVFVFTHFFYGCAFSMGGTLSFPLFIMASLLVAPRHAWLRGARIFAPAPSWRRQRSRGRPRGDPAPYPHAAIDQQGRSG